MVSGITGANTNKGTATVSTNGYDVLPVNQWVTAAELKAYTDAIAEAQGVVDNTDATQAQVDAAVTALQTATTAFNTGKEAGKAVDKTALTTAITGANSNKGTAAVSTDGSNVDPADQWVTAAELKAYTDAIAAAQAIVNSPSATQAEVNAAIAALATATTKFNAAKEVGTKIVGGGDVSNDGGSVTDSNIIVIVDGVSHQIGKEDTQGESTISTPDQELLQEEIEKASESVIVPVSKNTIVSTALIVKNVEDMKKKGMDLSIQTGKIAYNIKTEAIDVKSIMAAFPGVDTADIQIDVIIKDVSGKVTVPEVNETEIVIAPIEFLIVTRHGEKDLNIDTLDSFINRTIEITEDQSKRITTAVVIEPNGTLRHVPTEVTKKDGKWYAIVNSMTNSYYTLIYNEKSFVDVEGKWYEDVVTEMASRKIYWELETTCLKGTELLRGLNSQQWWCVPLGCRLPVQVDSMMFHRTLGIQE